MSLSSPFIHRPVGTTLLTIAIALAGAVAYFSLPISPLPQVDFPTIVVSANLPGASPQTMASSVATPLERQFGRIAGIAEMSSSSTQGATSVTMVFDLNRNIDAAARDVQAAINAARSQLPAELPNNPSYKKVNPVDAPILILSLTSTLYTRAQIYDAASSILQQKISQIKGVGQVSLGGGAAPAVRVEVDPLLLNTYGIGLDDVRTMLASQNVNHPKGSLSDDQNTYQISANDQLKTASDYRPLIVMYKNGGPLRLGDVADVIDSVEDVRSAGLLIDHSAPKEKDLGGGSQNRSGLAGAADDYALGAVSFEPGHAPARGAPGSMAPRDGSPPHKTAGSGPHGPPGPATQPAGAALPAIMLVINRQPGANIIDTVQRIKDAIPQLQSEIPAGIRIGVPVDRSVTIRASVTDVQLSLCISIALVILVVFVFLRNVRSTFIPSVAVPVSLIGTFGVMYLCNYSLDNLSLMALTVATGFVVDDAIVVIENITRLLEEGKKPLEAALTGAREIGFTVVSMSVSLVAVFIPILLMPGIIGRLFREFAVVLSVAVGVSMVVSLTATPMMCAVLLKSRDEQPHGRLYLASERIFDWVLNIYRITLGWALRQWILMLLLMGLTLATTVLLWMRIPTGLFPQQDTGRSIGQITADQKTSYQSMEKLLHAFASVVSTDPAVDKVVAFTGSGGGATNVARMFVVFKPLGVRKDSADQINRRISQMTARIPGAQLFMQSVQDLRIGGRPAPSQYQYTLQGDNLEELNFWTARLQEKIGTIDGVTDATSDLQVHGLSADLNYDRATARRLGVSAASIDSALYDAFGQRQVSTIYNPLNQIHVVSVVKSQFWQNPDSLNFIYVKNTSGEFVPLFDLATLDIDNTPLSVNHTGQYPSNTVSFNLRPGVSLSNIVAKIQQVQRELGLPASIHGNFQGTAQAYNDSLSSMPLLLLGAIVAVYLVLGILYESLIHPLTILSTLPSAGVGAFIALLLFHMELNVLGWIGIILLIGIVKKNAIMMIDFAIQAERTQGLSPADAIFQACLLRFRPILMTTMAALLGGLPLAFGTGTGSELRRPLGIAIVGGLIFSQLLTLYTTPVIYLCLERLRLWIARLTHGDAALSAASAPTG